jgi:hypothetical protein
VTEISPAQAAYEAWQRVRFPDNPVPWNHPALGSKTRNAWDAAAQAGTAPLREQLADTTAERDKYRDTLKRIADPDAWVLNEGLGGGFAEEHHVRASLARQALGLDVDCCTECMVSLGIEPEDVVPEDSKNT